MVRTLLGLLIVCVLAGCSRELPPGARNNFHPFGVAHASLTFEYFGDMRGYEEFYEDSNGVREDHLVHSELITKDGFRPTYTNTIRNVEKIVIIDSVKNQEIHLIDPTSDSLFRLPIGDVPSPEDQFTNYAQRHNYALQGDTVIRASGMNLKAHIWKLGLTESYMYEFEGIVVGSTTVIEGHEHSLQLTSIDTMHAIDPSRFVASHGFPVLDLTKRSISPTQP